MEISFDCTCGERVSEFTRGEDGNADKFGIVCDECESRYAVSVTKLLGAE